MSKKELRKAVFEFCQENSIETPFNLGKRAAGKDWLNGFLKRHPDVRNRQTQNLNEARAQKMNHFIVDDYFKTLKDMLLQLDIVHKPQRIFNLDEKGIRMCRHKSGKVLAKRGVRRVHRRGKEKGESVTVVAAGSAIGVIIPPFILFKGKRKNPEWKNLLPPGSEVEMTDKGSMTAEKFVLYLRHFAQYKPEGQCLLLVDGAKCHFSLAIAKEAERLQIELLCLPSNTTHELQPCDKCLFRPLEYAWDDEVDLFWEVSDQNKLDKVDFCKIFTKAWARASKSKNMISGFEACGIYPFNPSRIPTEAFAPSAVTHCKATPSSGEGASLNSEETLTQALTSSDMGVSTSNDVQPSTASSGNTHSGSSVASFRKFATPEIKKGERKQTKKALNYKAVRIGRNLFPEESQNTESDETESDEEGSEAEPEFCATVKKDDFILVFIIFDFGSKKEMKKFYVGKVTKLKVGRQGKQIEVNFLRKISTKNADNGMIGFSERQLQDVWKINLDQIVQNLQQPAYERRGRIFFAEWAIKCDEVIQ